jgi:hypothetical protein
MPHKIFDRSRLKLRPLAERQSELTRDIFITPDSPFERCEQPALPVLAERIREARTKGSAVILMLGAHVIRRGAAPLLIDLMKRGLITHLALNGAGAIHDYELALIGRTIVAGDFPYAETSLLAAGFRLGFPVTVHVAIGQDIIHEHPNFDATATGMTTYRDFLILAESICGLEGGVLLNIGTAVMGPEVYLKALTMARNVAVQEGRSIAHFTTAVFDLQPLGAGDVRKEAPKTDPRYYFRPYKTILVRTVADGGESFYVQGDHASTLPTLYHLIVET